MIHLGHTCKCKKCTTPPISHPAVWGDEARDAHQPGVGEQLGHLGYTADVLLSVFRAEAQVFVQTLPDVVAVQSIAGDSVTHQVLLQSHAHRRLARSRQTFGYTRREDLLQSLHLRASGGQLETIIWVKIS